MQVSSILIVQLEKLKATDTKTKDNTRKIEMLTKKGDELGQQVEKLKEDLAKKTQAYDVVCIAH